MKFDNIVYYYVSVISCSASFTISNALQKFGHHSCAPWQFLVYRGVFQIAVMLLFRCTTLIEKLRKQVCRKCLIN